MLCEQISENRSYDHMTWTVKHIGKIKKWPPDEISVFATLFSQILLEYVISMSNKVF